MTEKLKRCPFCGGKAFEYYSGSQFEFCEVVCKECGCRSKRKTEEEAIASWNTRKPMDRIVERLEEKKILCNEIAKEAIETDHLQLRVASRNQAIGFAEAIAIVKGVQNE